MHVAVCDDNIADRKQMERLLKREADKHIKAGDTLYIDSYGNQEALLHNPMQYDVFYIDMCKTEGISVPDLVDAMIKKGVFAPIVLCCSDIDYAKDEYPDNVFFLDKPIKADELAASINHAKELKTKAPSTIELRDEHETYYVTEPDILYATRDGSRMMIQLADGRVIEDRTTLLNLYSQWEMHESFVPLGNQSIINCRHVTDIGLIRVKMSDGQSFTLPGNMRSYVKGICERLKK